MQKIEELNNEEIKDDVMYFEETGVDALFVDEAHLFKNLEIFTKMNNVAGLGSSGSQRAMDMRMKIQYINEKNQEGASLWQREPLCQTQWWNFM